LSSYSAKFELFNLQDDPFELDDLSGDYPQLVDSFRNDYYKWYEDVSSTRKNNYETPRVIIGNDAGTKTVLTRQDWIREVVKWWGDKGCWLLTVDRDATFDISVKTADPKPGWNVTLTVGNVIKKGLMKGNFLTFKGIELKKGDITISSEVTKGNKIYSRMHVFIDRISVND